MTTLRFMGSEARIREVFDHLGIRQTPVGGHTDVVVRPDNSAEVARGRALFNHLVHIKAYSAIDTTVKESPVRVTDFNPSTQQEIVFVPQMAGG